MNISVEYSDCLKGMGYSEDWIRKVVYSSLTGYERLLYKVDKGETGRNNLGEDTHTSRRYRHLLGNQE